MSLQIPRHICLTCSLQSLKYCSSDFFFFSNPLLQMMVRTKSTCWTFFYTFISPHKNSLWRVYIIICRFFLFKSKRGKTQIKKLLRIWHSAQNKIHGCILMRKDSATSSCFLFKRISCHIEINILVILSKPGGNKHLGFVTQSTPQVPMNWLLQAACTEGAQVCTRFQRTMRTSLFVPLFPISRKFPALVTWLMSLF